LIYVLDTNVISNLHKNYYRKRFISLWMAFDQLVAEGRITSTREAYHELHDGVPGGDTEWAKANEELFAIPDAKEGAFVGQIYSVAHFQANIEKQKILKGDAPMTERPGKSLPPVDLEAVRARVEKELGGKSVDDEDLHGYLMYPKVFLDYMGRHKTYGPVRTLPTKTFFYGMEPGEEISVPYGKGKELITLGIAEYPAAPPEPAKPQNHRFQRGSGLVRHRHDQSQHHIQGAGGRKG
jgi:hypothetical protein